jgi:hypothetical protein
VAIVTAAFSASTCTFSLEFRNSWPWATSAARMRHNSASSSAVVNTTVSPHNPWPEEQHPRFDAGLERLQGQTGAGQRPYPPTDAGPARRQPPDLRAVPHRPPKCLSNQQRGARFWQTAVRLGGHALYVNNEGTAKATSAQHFTSTTYGSGLLAVLARFVIQADVRVGEPSSLLSAF